MIALVLFCVAAPARFALVIGNNAPPDASAQALKFADDDAIMTEAVLTDAGVESTLFVAPDKDTTELHPGLKSTAPTRAAILAGYEKIIQRMRSAGSGGREVEFIFYYSGHGGVDHGDGYITLADGKLTRPELYAQILARSPATRNHVIVDACKSYYLIYGRGPGGERVRYEGLLPMAEAAQTNIGYILSTSSDADSHEWEKFGAGIFSYEVRSALRGAADANADGAISYAELGAFLERANQEVSTPRYRPHFLVRAPGAAPGDARLTLLDWHSDSSTLTLDRGTEEHISIEAQNGDRVLDAHPDGSGESVLHLPAERPLFVRRQNDREYVMDHLAARLSALTAGSLPARSKGALHLAFSHIFEDGFGGGDVQTFATRYSNTPDVLLRLRPSPASNPLPVLRQVFTWTAVATLIAAGAVALGSWQVRAGAENANQVQRDAANRSIASLNLATIITLVTGGATGITAATLWLVPNPPSPEY